MALLATPETRPALEAPKEPGPGTGPVQAGEIPVGYLEDHARWMVSS